MAKPRIHWDHYFAQWMTHWLPQYDLRVEAKPQFSQLPLEADVMVIRRPDNHDAAWQSHPLWRHLSPFTVLEFKSVKDLSRPHPLEMLSSYVTLSFGKYEQPSGTEIAGWLVVPSMRGSVKTSLEAYELPLKETFPGFWQCRTALFPLAVVEYERLPNTEAFFGLKTFMATGPELQTAMLLGLHLLEGSPLYDEYLRIITAIHKAEAKTMIEVLDSEKANMAEVIDHFLTTSPDMAEQISFIQQTREEGELKGKLEEKLENARQMKIRGLETSLIADVTGLSTSEIEAL